MKKQINNATKEIHMRIIIIASCSKYIIIDYTGKYIELWGKPEYLLHSQHVHTGTVAYFVLISTAENINPG